MNDYSLTVFTFDQKKKIPSLNLVNGSYQYPIKGRPLFLKEVNDVSYTPNVDSIRSKGKQVVIGRTKKFFDVRDKELKSRQGPSTYRPKHASVMQNEPKYTIPKSHKKSKFEKPVGEGADRIYHKAKPFAHNAKHGYLRKSKLHLHTDNKVPGVGSYTPRDNATMAQSY